MDTGVCRNGKMINRWMHRSGLVDAFLSKVTFSTRLMQASSPVVAPASAPAPTTSTESDAPNVGGLYGMEKGDKHHHDHHMKHAHLRMWIAFIAGIAFILVALYILFFYDECLSLEAVAGIAFAFILGMLALYDAWCCHKKHKKHHEKKKKVEPLAGGADAPVAAN
jgi:hypothetical protein